VAAEESGGRTRDAAELDAKGRELAELKGVLEERNGKLAEAQAAQASSSRSSASSMTQSVNWNSLSRSALRTVSPRSASRRCVTRRRAAAEGAREGPNHRVDATDHRGAETQGRPGSQQLQARCKSSSWRLCCGRNFRSMPSIPCEGRVWRRHRAKRAQSGRPRERHDSLGDQAHSQLERRWLVKLREDQRTAKAELCVLVSAVLPKGVETFDIVDGSGGPSALCAAGRHGAAQHADANIHGRQVSEGQQSKTEMVYQYLTGPRFRQRVEAIVEPSRRCRRTR